ncbi:MAG TPA: alpha/beta hydrolase [Acidobacteriota bacterium]|nr:alpha/beta hydrolase [Acidobacteriota bacterium]
MLQRVCILICAISLIATAALAQPAPAPGPPPTGSGPYPAVIEGDPGVPGHTIYRPENLSAFSQKNSLPVVAWGNGGCANSSAFYAPFLAEIASQGFLVVAIGPFTPGNTSNRGGGMGGGMGMGSSTKSAQLLEALDWASAENKRQDSKYYQKLDPSKFAVFGHSCGGLQALEVSSDPRVTTVLVMDSGIFGPGAAPKIGMPPGGAPKSGAPQGEAPQAGMPQRGMMPGGTPQGGAPKMPAMGGAMAIGKDALQKLHSPVIYIIGGEKDIAYPQAVDDFAKIDKVPVAMANLDVGHGGTYNQPNGGEFGRVAVAWLKWQLKKDETAGKMFSGQSCGLCKDDKWKFEKKKME